ncbi:MAG: flippase-like domain-containing protein [Alphaproteobacteria bacterium]|nr:flippase-like domain-containing protein [Alphaproteobacteria bacterium]
MDADSRGQPGAAAEVIRLAALLGLLGLAAATGIIIANGYQQILAALAQAGWGIIWASLFHLVPMTCCIIGWRALMPERQRPSHAFFLYVLWLRTSMNNLLPVARIGGEILAARVMIKHGIRNTSAIASTVVETTLSVIGVFLFDVIGITMFALHISDKHVGWRLAAGLLMSVPVIAALVVVQRIGFFGLLSKIFNMMFRTTWEKFAGGAARLDRAVHAMYRRKDRILICGFWQFMAWVMGVPEIWLALQFLGHPLPWAECFMIEALIQASSSVAFAVPGAIGVQEASFLVFGQMLGLTPEVAVALAVMRRCRDLLLYIPGLIVWQIQEGRWLLGKTTK